MNSTAPGKSGSPNYIAGIKIPAMYSCLLIEDITFSFNKSFFRPVRATTIQDDITNMRSSNPSEAKLFIFGHTDNVGTIEYNKDLSDRRTRSIYSFLTLDNNGWLKLHNKEHWGKIEVQQVILALQSSGAGNCPPKSTLPIEAYIGISGTKINDSNLLKLYKDYMEHLLSKKLDINSDFFYPKAFAGCSEFNPVVAASNKKDKVTRDLENEPNRRVVIFLLELNAIMPCEIGSIKPCKKYRYKNPGKSSGLFGCEFYDQMIINGKCPKELERKTPSPVSPQKVTDLEEIKVSLGFPASEVEEWILKKYKTDPVFFTKIIEPLEVEAGGSVKSVLPEELDVLKKEAKLKGKKSFTIEKPFCLVKTKIFYKQNKFYFKAEVIIRETGEKLFEEEVSAPRLIGIEGHWEKTGKKVWRHVRKGSTLRPGYETKYLQGLGLDNFRNDLYLMLHTDRKGRWKEFRNITEKVKDIMKKRGYKVK